MFDLCYHVRSGVGVVTSQLKFPIITELIKLSHYYPPIIMFDWLFLTLHAFFGTSVLLYLSIQAL